MTEASEAVKGCKIKELSSTAKGLKGYKMDEAISIMAACSHSVCMLKQKAAPDQQCVRRKPRVQSLADCSSS